MHRQLAKDFVHPEDRFPNIAFDDTNEESDVTFKYNYTGIHRNTQALPERLRVEVESLHLPSSIAPTQACYDATCKASHPQDCPAMSHLVDETGSSSSLT
jgi:hypothetical protein